MDIFPVAYNPHIVEFLEELLGGFNAEGVIRRKLLNLGDERGDISTYFIVVGVVLPVLKVIAMHNPGLPPVCLHLPVVEVDFLEKFLLMMF